MYDADSRVLWASHTSGNSGAVELVVQNDMNVVLYKSRGRVPLWATNTHTAVCPDAGKHSYTYSNGLKLVCFCVSL